ncbi:MAG TPA: GIY-YIG nuclease family protein [Ignavibacteriaceae bacterium]|nr:GIY-YIG nuclease family protein [Ignavibacteriaceae bacterium]
MEYLPYILYSPKFIKTYVGQTDNLEKRLVLHNSAKVKSTKPFIPWVLIHSESFTSRAEAMKREKWFKSKSGRKKISEILKNFLESEDNSLSDSAH